MTSTDVAVRTLLIVCAAFVPCSAARAQSPQPPAAKAGTSTQDGAATARLVIRQLDGADFALRRAAQLKLNSLGGDALPAVKAALADDLTSPEAKIRLKAALPYLEARAKREGPERERVAWKLAQIRTAYDTGGGANPRWDAQVHAAIDLFLKLPADPRTAPQRQAAALAAFAKAADAWCDDPLFLAMYHLAVGEKFGRGEGPVEEPLDRIVAKVQQGRYSPVVKFWLASRYVRATRQWNAELTQQAVLDFRRIAAMPGLPPTELESCANQFYDALDRIGGGADVFGKHMLTEAYKAVAPRTHGALLVEGRNLLGLAWKVYGSNEGAGRDVSPALWNEFSGYLAQAADVLEAAWKLDPTDARPAALLITCQLGDQGGQRQGVEDWFARAVDADPDCLLAYDRKMYTLNPWWFGDGYDDAIAFGRECLKTENWRAGVPMMLVTAHRLASEASGDSKAYYARPEVWADLSAVYEGQLVNFPDDALRRSELANAAARSGRWDVVRQQFDLLGDRAVVSVFGGKAEMDYLKRKAARLARAAATTTPSTTTAAPATPK